MRLIALLTVPTLCLLLPAAGPPPRPAPLSNGEPRSPRDALATFRVPDGFRVELVASEPHVVDPVAMAFDERGRIFVAEMRGYPNGGLGTGFITSGRVRLLEDRDNDGTYETSSLVADNLRFPTGLMPWRGGLLVANAPDLLYIKDGKRAVLYSGFDIANIQQLLNSLQLGLDGWVHACAGGAGGTIRSAQKPDAPAVTLRGRGIRFKPDVPASLEPTSGGGQYGLAPDAWGRWFTATNSQHLRHIVLPDHYLRRNPNLAVGAVTLDIPEHGAACRVYRTSPFEAWRVLRTAGRKGGPDAARFPPTELFPGGYSTSACSPVVYNAELFPPEYRGSAFICDPANNLIIRDTLHEHGATFLARRGHAAREFLTSTDNWFRPVHLTLGPDGALYVLDFYREAIETPLSIPDELKKRMNLESRGRGRIWRITTAPAGKRPAPPALDRATTKELVAQLANANAWWRYTAQRLLIERNDKDAAAAPLEEVAQGKSAVGRLHALRTLDALGRLRPALIEAALADKEAGVREHALQLAEAQLKSSKSLAKAVLALADDPSPRVRFQLAFTLGALEGAEATTALAKLAARGDNDRWAQTAILTSAGQSSPALLEAVVKEAKSAKAPGQLTFLTRLASVVGAGADDDALARAFALLGKANTEPASWQLALLDGLGQGLQNSSRSLAALWDKPPAKLAAPLREARALFDAAAHVAADEAQPAARRAEAVALLGRGPFAPLKKHAASLLSAASPPEVQLAAARALGAHARAEVAGLLLAAWPSASPTLRRELAEALFARRERLAALVTALEQKKVLAAQLEPARLRRLRALPDAKLRARAVKVLAGQAAPARAKVIESYQAALKLKGDSGAGKKVFAKHCASCHKLDGVGTQVGADLLAALPNKTADALLIDILDPSREVDPRYLAYQVTTKRGQVLTGLIESETATSLTLRRGEGASDTVLRAQVESVESTGGSLMPEGLEQQLAPRDVADVIAYLLSAGRAKGRP